MKKEKNTTPHLAHAYTPARIAWRHGHSRRLVIVSVIDHVDMTLFQ